MRKISIASKCLEFCENFKLSYFLRKPIFPCNIWAPIGFIKKKPHFPHFITLIFEHQIFELKTLMKSFYFQVEFSDCLVFSLDSVQMLVFHCLLSQFKRFPGIFNNNPNESSFSFGANVLDSNDIRNIFRFEYFSISRTLKIMLGIELSHKNLKRAFGNKVSSHQTTISLSWKRRFVCRKLVLRFLLKWEIFSCFESIDISPRLSKSHPPNLKLTLKQLWANFKTKCKSFR